MKSRILTKGFYTESAFLAFLHNARPVMKSVLRRYRSCIHSATAPTRLDFTLIVFKVL